jgi:hypothetical protein
MTLDQVREELVKMLKLARAGSKAVDPTARAFASGHAAGLEDAIKLINSVLQAKHAADRGGGEAPQRIKQFRNCYEIRKLRVARFLQRALRTGTFAQFFGGTK